MFWKIEEKAARPNGSNKLDLLLPLESHGFRFCQLCLVVVDKMRPQVAESFAKSYLVMPDSFPAGVSASLPFVLDHGLG